MSAHSVKDRKNTTRFVDMVGGMQMEIHGKDYFQKGYEEAFEKQKAKLKAQKKEELDGYYAIKDSLEDLIEKVRKNPRAKDVKDAIMAKREELDNYIKAHPLVQEHLKYVELRKKEDELARKARNLVHERRNSLTEYNNAKEAKAKARAEAGIAKAMASIQTQRKAEEEARIAKAKALEEAKAAKAKADEYARTKLVEKLNEVLGGYGYN